MSLCEVAGRNALVEKHLGMADAIVACLCQRLGGRRVDGLERDDLLQEARIGLIHAADTFDDKRGTDFTTWATTCIRSKLRDLLRASTRALDCISLDNLDVAAAPDAMREAENRISSQQLIVRLPLRQREAIQLHCVSGHNKSEVARRMSISPARAGQLIKDGLHAMRAAATSST